MFKEFALQDAGMLGGTQAALETGRRSREFPLSDQEILVRHFHKVVGDWVERPPARARSERDAMTDALLPAAFADLEPFAATWCLATEAERWRPAHGQLDGRAAARSTTRASPASNEAIEHCDKFPLDDLPADVRAAARSSSTRS